jgi:FtsZ-binding cell division protein ZapB
MVESRHEIERLKEECTRLKEDSICAKEESNREIERLKEECTKLRSQKRDLKERIRVQYDEYYT